MGCCINGKSNIFFNQNFFLLENNVIKSQDQIIIEDNFDAVNKPKKNNNKNKKKKEIKDNMEKKENKENKINKTNDNKNNNDNQKNSVCSSELSDPSKNQLKNNKFK